MTAEQLRSGSRLWLRSHDLNATHIEVSAETERVTALTSVQGTGSDTDNSEGSHLDSPPEALYDSLDRRAFLATLAGGLLAAPIAAEGQYRAGKVPRVGILNSDTAQDARVDEFRDGLRELGYVEGQNLLRWTPPDRRPGRSPSCSPGTPTR